VSQIKLMSDARVVLGQLTLLARRRSAFREAETKWRMAMRQVRQCLYDLPMLGLETQTQLLLLYNQMIEIHHAEMLKRSLEVTQLQAELRQSNPV
jgi:hypothetical protein